MPVASLDRATRALNLAVAAIVLAVVFGGAYLFIKGHNGDVDRCRSGSETASLSAEAWNAAHTRVMAAWSRDHRPEDLDAAEVYARTAKAYARRAAKDCGSIWLGI